MNLSHKLIYRIQQQVVDVDINIPEMKSKSFLVFTVILFLWFKTNASEAIPLEGKNANSLGPYPLGLNPENTISLECGGIINLPQQGNMITVEYKALSSYNNDERCLWTLNNVYNGVRKTIYAGIKLLMSGFETCCDGVSLLHFNHSIGLSSLELVNDATHKLGAEAMFLSFTSNAAKVGQGFIIQIDVIQASGSFPGNHLSYASPFASNSFSSGAYKDYDIITVAINPLGSDTLFTVKNVSTEIHDSTDFCDFDRLQVFEIKSKSLPSDSQRMRLCGVLKSNPASFHTSDSILVIFSADHSNTGDGFGASWI